MEQLNPSFTGIRYDEVSVVRILSLDLNLSTTDLRQLIYVFTLDIEADTAPKHKHFKCPCKWSNRFVDNNKRTVLQRGKTKAVNGFSS